MSPTASFRMVVEPRKRKWRFENTAWAALLVLGLLVTAPLPARAATLTVDSTADTNTATTLRFAINNAAAGDTISFGSAVAGGTITVNSGGLGALPAIGNPLTLLNNSGGSVIINASSQTSGLTANSTLSLGGLGALVLSLSNNAFTLNGIDSAGALSIGSWGSNAKVTVTTTNSLAVGLAGTSISISDGLAGTILAAGQQSLGLRSTFGGISISGGISGTIRATGTNGTSGGMAANNGISITDGISGTIEASAAGGGTGYGLWTSTGDLSVSGGVSGTVTATGPGSVYGLRSVAGQVNGGSAGSPLHITGTVSATSTGGAAYGVNSNQNANLYVTGTVSGTGNNSANSHAVTGGAGSLLTLGTGAGLGGSVNLGGGASTLTLVGTGSAANLFQNVTNLVAGGGGTSTSWALNPAAANTSSFSTVTVNPGASLSVNENVTFTGNATDNGNLTFDLGSALTYAGVISGSGSVTKAGAGTLTLTGANSYSGGTTVSQGSLSVSSYSLLGGGAITFAGGQLLVAGSDVLSAGLTIPSSGVVFNTSGDQTISTALAGTGSVTKSGSGTLTLRGINTYTGGTYFNGGVVNILSDSNLGASSGPLVFNGGTLQIGADIASSRSVNLLSGGGRLDTNGYNLTLSGDMDGPGALTKSGAGTLYLRGGNTYLGGTNINGGIVNIASDSNLGAASGGVAFAGGTLRIDGDVTTSRPLSVLNGGGSFDNNGNRGTLAGSISGSTQLHFQGAGTTTLTGDGTGFTGQADLSQGVLFMGAAGRLGGSLTVNQGAAIGGYGTVGILANNGLVSPGGSIGTLNVSGNYVQGPSASFYDEISPGGQGDLLAVAGSATLNGGLLRVAAPQAFYPTGMAWPVITAGQGLTGAFGAVEQTLASISLVFLPVYSDGGATLVALRVPYATYAPDGRAATAGSGLNAAAFLASGEMAALLATLDYSPSAVTGYTLGILSPEPYDAFTQGLFDAGQVLTAAQIASVNGWGTPGGSAFSGPLETGPATQRAFSDLQKNGQAPVMAPLAGGQEYSVGVFLRPFGMRASQEAGSGRTGYSTLGGGLTGGIALRTGSGLTLALAPGYFSQSFSLRNLGGGSGTVNDWSLALVGSWRGRDWFVDGVVRAGYDSYEANRTMPLPLSPRSARAVWSGWNTSVAVGGGYDFHLGEWTLGPLASLEWQRIDQGAFSEARAGNLGLSVGGRADGSLTSTVGGRISRPFETRLGVVTPELRLAWRAQWLDLPRRIPASYIGYPQSGFTTQTAGQAYNSAVLDAAVTMAMSQSLSVSARVGMEFLRPGYENQAFSLALKYSF